MALLPIHDEIIPDGSLIFDGQDDYINLPDIEADFGNGFTLEAWVYYTAFHEWSRIIDLGNGATSDNILLTNVDSSNTVSFQVFDGDSFSGIYAEDALALNQWTHLAATVDSSGQAILYKNGQALVTDTIHLPRNIKRSQNFLGRSNWPDDQYFSGSNTNQ